MKGLIRLIQRVWNSVFHRSRTRVSTPPHVGGGWMPRPMRRSAVRKRQGGWLRKYRRKRKVRNRMARASRRINRT